MTDEEFNARFDELRDRIATLETAVNDQSPRIDEQLDALTDLDSDLTAIDSGLKAYITDVANAVANNALRTADPLGLYVHLKQAEQAFGDAWAEIAGVDADVIAPKAVRALEHLRRASFFVDDAIAKYEERTTT